MSRHREDRRQRDKAYPSVSSGAVSEREARSLGFTLIEVLVSVVMLGIIASAVLGTLWTSLQSWEKGIQVAEDLQTKRALLERVSSELKSTLHEVKSGRSRVAGESHGSGARSEDVLLFVSSMGGWPGRVVIQYRVGKAEGEREPGLLRSEVLLPGKIDWEKVEKALKKEERLFVPGIVGMNVQYYDGEQWQEEWDPEGAKANVPKAVRLVFNEEGADGDEKPFPEILVSLIGKEKEWKGSGPVNEAPR